MLDRTRLASTLLACAAASSVVSHVHAQCGSGGGCFAVHGPGCDDVDCCSAVCALDGFCCAVTWDALCVNEANDACVTFIAGGPFGNPETGSSYYILDQATWLVLKNHAGLLGGHLVTINSAEENQWLVETVMQAGFAPDYFIRLSDKEVEGQFTWLDNAPLSVTFWDNGQPDNFGPGEDVVHVWSATGKWNDLPTTAVRIGVVEIEPPGCGELGTGSCFQIHGPFCDEAACCESVCAIDIYCCQVFWDGACVGEANAGCHATPIGTPIVNPLTGRRHRLLDTGYWAVAASKAESLGERLVTIDSGETNEFVRRWLMNGFPGGGAGTAWLGASDASSEGEFAWQSGAPFDFTRWAPGEPNNASNEDAVGMFAFLGEWNDFGPQHTFRAVSESGSDVCGQGGSCFESHGSPGCESESCCNNVCVLDPFCCGAIWDGLCAVEANQMCAPTILSGPVVNPATGHAYYFVSPALWSEAERLAIEMGGHLAVPNTYGENGWLTANLYANWGASHAFIGIHDQLKEGVYQGVDTASAVAIAVWGFGEPNDLDAADALFLTVGGGWGDTSINTVLPSIIEVPCIGDINLDRSVDAADLALLLGSWGNAPGSTDLNVDGSVDAADLALLLGGWGPCATSDCCTAHGGAGCDQPACSSCVCNLEPTCCAVAWDAECVQVLTDFCSAACQCGG